ncbi:SMI1/KNR4 family protein [Actinacidiphila soli]|uniref:SMI1/KNR4 family protein n=1 Tax=Actinacidiphila soli TaxID=2487275 RepID=UPI000FCB3657|nr:SMI1/KNR4 family protein [Actinacidiphila soli]
MTVHDTVRALRPLAGDLGARSGAETAYGYELPEAHRELLRELNGFTAYHGAFRLFGTGRPAHLDLAAWNAPQTWRFAWDERAEPFVFFGETAWGDQYAYRREPGGRLAPEVHFLEGNFLRSEVIAGSFEEFLADELLRNAKEPYDELTVEAVERYGPIAADQHWAFVPSLAMDGTEDIGQVMQLPAVTAMVYAGDIATAVGAAAPDDLLTGVAPWTDDQGRARLRVLSVGLS